MEYKIKKVKKSSCITLSRGFSAVEVLVVIAVLAVLISSIVPSFINFRRNSVLNTETQGLLTIINRARLLSVSSKNDNQFGVHFESSRATLFQGGTYSATSTTNEVYVFDSALILSSIVVNGGGSELVFEKVTGATSQNATTTLLIVGTTASTTVVTLPTGVATIF